MSINRVAISGNLTREPDLRATGSGMSILSLRLASGERRKVGGDWADFTNYVDVVVFGSRAESLSRFLSKGSKVFIEGRLRYEEWCDRKTGDKRSCLKVIADDVELGGYRQDGGSSSARNPMFDDDIPFAVIPRSRILEHIEGHRDARTTRVPLWI